MAESVAQQMRNCRCAKRKRPPPVHGHRWSPASDVPPQRLKTAIFILILTRNRICMAPSGGTLNFPFFGEFFLANPRKFSRRNFRDENCRNCFLPIPCKQTTEVFSFCSHTQVINACEICLKSKIQNLNKNRYRYDVKNTYDVAEKYFTCK